MCYGIVLKSTVYRYIVIHNHLTLNFSLQLFCPNTIYIFKLLFAHFAIILLFSFNVVLIPLTKRQKLDRLAPKKPPLIYQSINRQVCGALLRALRSEFNAPHEAKEFGAYILIIWLCLSKQSGVYIYVFNLCIWCGFSLSSQNCRATSRAPFWKRW